MDNRTLIASMQKIKSFCSNHSIWLIVLLGFGLRMNQAGVYSLWNDEAGQLQAALQPTMGGMLSYIQGHAMAMPFDYLITSLISHFSLSELVLRLPSILWSTLMIPVIYRLAMELLSNSPLSKRFSLIAALLMALSPIHVFFGQEMRFYAALGFFYLLSTLLMVLFLRNPGTLRWIVMTGTLLVGEFFHPFVLLALVNGIFLLLSVIKRTSNWKMSIPFRQIWLLGLTGLLGVSAFILWMIIMHPSSKFEYDVFQYNLSAAKLAFESLGWMAIKFCDGISLIGPWEILLVLTTLGGLAALAMKGREISRPFIALLLGMVVQVSLMALLVYVRGYWLLYRQFIHLAPIMMMISALGLTVGTDWLKTHFNPTGTMRNLRMVSFLAMVLFICLSAAPRLNDYYHSGKSNARQIIEAALTNSNEPASLFVIPGYEGKVYQVYLQALYQESRITVKAADLSDLAEIPIGHNYVVLPKAAGDPEILIRAGYRPLLIPEESCSGTRTLYEKYVK